MGLRVAANVRGNRPGMVWFLGASTILTVVSPHKSHRHSGISYSTKKKSQHTLYASTLNDLDISYTRGDTVVHLEGDSDAAKGGISSVTPLLHSVGQPQQYALVVDAFLDLDRLVLQRGDFSRVGQVEGKWMGQSGRFEEQGQHRDLVVKCRFSTRMTVTHQQLRAQTMRCAISRPLKSWGMMWKRTWGPVAVTWALPPAPMPREAFHLARDSSSASSAASSSAVFFSPSL